MKTGTHAPTLRAEAEGSIDGAQDKVGEERRERYHTRANRCGPRVPGIDATLRNGAFCNFFAYMRKIPRKNLA